MTIGKKICPALTEPKYGKPMKILVWINGEFESIQQEVQIKPSDLRSWNGILNSLTEALQPRFGAVRKLYHLGTRKMVECLKHIQPNERFVAVGRERIRFKKNGYLTGEERHALQKSKPSKNSVQIEENIKSLLNFMDYTRKKKRTVIYVMVSGRTCQEPLKVVLTRDDLKAWDMVLVFLGYQLDLEEGVQLIKIRKPKKLRSALFVTKKYKTKSAKCLKMKCPVDCQQIPSPTSSSTAEAQTILSGSVDQSQKKDDKIVEVEGANLGSSAAEAQTVLSGSVDQSKQKDDEIIAIEGTNLDTYRTYIKEHLSEQSTEESSAESDEEATYGSVTDLVKSVLDEIIETCLLELEMTGLITPSQFSISRESIPMSDKVFFPDPIEKQMPFAAPQKTELKAVMPSIASCCAKYIAQRGTADREKIMTTFAELAKNKQLSEQMSRLSVSKESRTSITDAAVKFLQNEGGQPYQETIYEESEHILPTADIDAYLQRSPKPSILKVKPSEQFKKTSFEYGTIKSERNNEPHATFGLQVQDTSSEDDSEDYNTQEMYEKLKRTSSFTRRTRDSIMVTADRFAVAAERARVSTMATQKNLEDTGDNDKYVQTEKSNNDQIQDNNLKSRSDHSQYSLESTSELNYLPNESLSDIYHNYEENSNVLLANRKKHQPSSKTQQETGKKRISFHEDEQQETHDFSNCCVRSASHLVTVGTISDSQQHEIRRNGNNSKDKFQSKSLPGTGNKDNELHESDNDIKSEQEMRQNIINGNKSRNKGKSNSQGAKKSNEFSEDSSNDKNVNSDKESIDENFKSNRQQQPQNSADYLKNQTTNSESSETQNKEGKSSTLNLTCLRENCKTFACSEICLKE